MAQHQRESDSSLQKDERGQQSSFFYRFPSNPQERYIADSQLEGAESAEEFQPPGVSFPADSTHYMKFLSGNKKSDQYRNLKNYRKQIAKTSKLHYSASGIRLHPIPLCTEQTSRDRKIRFSVHVSCHEYPSY